MALLCRCNGFIYVFLNKSCWITHYGDFRRYCFGHDSIRTNFCIFSNCKWTENFSASSDDDTIFNGEVENPEDRQVAFVLLICKVGDDARVNYISNAERRSVLAMMRKFLNRAEKGMV